MPGNIQDQEEWLPAQDWLQDMPGLVPLSDEAGGALEQVVEMTADDWWNTLPAGLYNLYYDKYSLFDCYVDSDGVMEAMLHDLLDIALERHGDPDMPQEEWIEQFQELASMLSGRDRALHALYQFRYSFEQFLEWIPTLTHEELNAIRPYIEWESNTQE
jgi:hypothetical protein